ncbi:MULTISPECIES: DNA sulfur modification protein DndB [Paenibacillus]|uniref:DNA sulfur modification protein DndB n=1 Tax=Paenibacillus TaxID=44249 RepID=UPI00096E6096|nr:DNA sulfur modification protein DndB [Paenibacillus odorifer]OMD87530.1 hypothetical protein BSK53_00555 [Paenibacillus odorifer]
MKKDRIELEEKLKTAINNVKHNRKITEKISEIFREYKLPAGTFQSLVRSKNIYNLDVARLYVLTLSLSEVTNDDELIPSIYFTDKEIAGAKGYIEKTTSSENMELPISLPDVIKMSDEEYVTRVEVKLLVKMFHSQLIFYDYETQRSPKFKRRGDSFIEVPEINKDSVTDISKHMLNGTYLPDTITINIYSEQIEEISYNSKTQTLTINEEAPISILDGFHRLQGAIKAHSLNPDLTQQMFLSIRCYDKDTAKRFFGQINTVNIVKPERLKELKSEKYSDQIVKNLQRKSELTGRIASASAISEIAGQLTTFDILSDAIDRIFNPRTSIEEREVSDYLIDFFAYLVSYYLDEFKLNPNEYRNTKINHPLMFIGYVQIAKMFKDENRDLKDIKEYVNRIDFNDSILAGLLENRRGLNSKKTRNAIIEYFESRGETNV